MISTYLPLLHKTAIYFSSIIKQWFGCISARCNYIIRSLKVHRVYDNNITVIILIHIDAAWWTTTPKVFFCILHYKNFSTNIWGSKSRLMVSLFSICLFSFFLLLFFFFFALLSRMNCLSFHVHIFVIFGALILLFITLFYVIRE